MVRKKSAKQGLAAKNKGTHRPKDTELADIGIRSSLANMSKGTASDGTEPKGAQKVLEEKQNLNELLLDSLPHNAMLIRKDRRILAANRSARDAGAKVEDYCWQSFAQSDFIPDEDKKYMDLILTVKEGHMYKYRNFSWDGQNLYNEKILSRALGLEKGDKYSDEDFEKAASIKHLPRKP